MSTAADEDHPAAALEGDPRPGAPRLRKDFAGSATTPSPGQREAIETC
jgi:hypothetical protein